MTSFATLALVAAITVGQTDTPPKHLKILQPLIGQWVYVGLTQSDSPSLGPKGTEIAIVVTYTWAIKQNALQIQLVAKTAHKKSVQFVELVGWDPQQKKLVSQCFGSEGTFEHSVWSVDGKTIIGDAHGVTDGGKEVTMKYLHTFEGDAMTLRYADMVVDGVKQPDEEYKYRRVR